MKKINAIAEGLLAENKRKSLNFSSLILIFSAFVEIALLLLNNLHVVFFNVDISNHSIIASATLIILASAITWVIPKHEKLREWIILGCAFAMMTIYDYLFSYYAFALILIPAVMATRFYDRKIMIKVGVMVLVSFGLSTLLTHIVAMTSPDVNVFSYKDGNADFRRVYDCTFDFLYKAVGFLSIYLVCFLISKNGKQLLYEQVDMKLETNSLENDMKKAAEIQKQVLPKDFDLAAKDGMDLFAYMKPAKEVAGDFYDFYKIGDNLYFLVGDVSDKGLYAAMFMMNVKNIIKSISLNQTKLEDIITQANNLICKDNQSLMFVTLWIGKINVKTLKGHFVNAGHSATFKKSGDKITKLESNPQPFIGAFPNYSYKSEPLDIKKGESIFLYTDGATDALNKNDKSFGEENLLKALEIKSNHSKDLCENIISSIDSFSEGKEQFDDITLLSLSLNDFDYDENFNCDHVHIKTIIDHLNNDLAGRGINSDLIGLIDSAIDDELDNIISYAYQGKDGIFRFQYKIADDELKIVVSDYGVPFNPLKIKPADLTPEREIGGLGIHLIKSIMDTVSYSGNENENILVLTKKLS